MRIGFTRPLLGMGSALLLAVGASVVAAMPAQAAYPASAETVCTPKLERFLANFGTVNGAHLQVTSSAGTPTGTATIKIYTMSGRFYRKYTLPLNSGIAGTALGKRLRAGTHLVSTQYVPTSGSVFKPCTGAMRTYTVTRAQARATVNVANVHRGGRAPIVVHVTGFRGINPIGKVQWTITRNGHRVDAHTSTRRYLGTRPYLTHRYQVRGLYKIRLVFVGSHNFHPSPAAYDTFRVR
jgi:hypothetical protein